MWILRIKSGPFEEQQVVLTTDPSLQYPIYYIFIYYYHHYLKKVYAILKIKNLLCGPGNSSTHNAEIEGVYHQIQLFHLFYIKRLYNQTRLSDLNDTNIKDICLPKATINFLRLFRMLMIFMDELL